MMKASEKKKITQPDYRTRYEKQKIEQMIREVEKSGGMKVWSKRRLHMSAMYPTFLKQLGYTVTLVDDVFTVMNDEYLKKESIKDKMKKI